MSFFKRLLGRRRLFMAGTALFALGLWGVPSFCVRGGAAQPYATWGQDRLWRVEQEIAALVDEFDSLKMKELPRLRVLLMPGRTKLTSEATTQAVRDALGSLRTRVKWHDRDRCAPAAARSR